MSEPIRPALNARSTSAAVSVELEGLGPLLRHAMDDVDLLERGADGFLALHGRGHVHRPELRAHAASPQPRDVGHQRRHRLDDVGLVEVAPRIEVAQRPRVIVVPVDQRRLFMKGPRAGQRIGLGRHFRHRPATKRNAITPRRLRCMARSCHSRGGVNHERRSRRGVIWRDGRCPTVGLEQSQCASQAGTGSAHVRADGRASETKSKRCAPMCIRPQSSSACRRRFAEPVVGDRRRRDGAAGVRA